MRASWSRVCVGAAGHVGLAGLVCPFASDTHFLKPPPQPMSSIHATSVAASRVEQALSEVASSHRAAPPSRAPCPWMTLAQIWLHAGSLPPAPPRLPLRPGGHAPGGRVHAGAGPLLPDRLCRVPGVRRSCFSSEPPFPPLREFTVPSPGVMSSAPRALSSDIQRPWERVGVWVTKARLHLGRGRGCCPCVQAPCSGRALW